MPEAHLYGLYGMYGPLTDPGERSFLDRCKVELEGLTVHGPYRDFDVQQIADEINALPTDATVLIQGTSLGANNAPVVAERVKRAVHGVFGFQASNFGYHSSITPNVMFSHLISSDNPLNMGLGAYRWGVEPHSFGGRVFTTVNDLHPGDYNPRSQSMFIDEIRRIMAKPNG